MSDEKLEELVNEYADLAKDKNIDASALLINALEQEDQNMVSSKSKRWAYLISLGFPPIGIAFGLYYYFNDYSDGKKVAYMCVGLTLFSLIFTIILFAGLFNSAGVSPQQIEKIKPADIYQLSQ